MAIELSEEEMRKALFGASVKPTVPKAPPPAVADAVPFAASSPTPRARNLGSYHSLKLRVTLHVSKEYEGDVDVFMHDSSSVSKLVAEQEAKAAAKKKKYKHLEVASIEYMAK